jgi:hypothetical protein
MKLVASAAADGKGGGNEFMEEIVEELEEARAGIEAKNEKEARDREESRDVEDDDEVQTETTTSPLPPAPSREEILEELREITSAWVENAEAVNAEIDRFITETTTGTFAIASDAVNTTPFMAEVWNGDAYDLTELDALTKLATELRTDLSKIGRDKLIDQVVTHFYGKFLKHKE